VPTSSPTDLALGGVTTKSPPASGLPTRAGLGVGAGAARRDFGAGVPARQRLYLEVCRYADTGLAVSILLGVFLLTNVERMPHGSQEFLSLRLTVKNLLLIVGFAVLWRLLCGLFGLYDWRTIRTRAAEAGRVLPVVACGSAAALTFPILSVTGAFGFAAVLYFWLGTSVALLLMRNGVRSLLGADSSEAANAIIVGSGPRALRLSQSLHAGSGDIHLLGFVDSAGRSLPSDVREPLLGAIGDLEHILMRHAVDDVLIALPTKSCYTEIQEVIGVCERVGVRARYLGDVFHHSRAVPTHDGGGALALVSLLAAPDDYRLAVKRASDIAGAALGLVALAPVILIVAIAVRLTSPGPVFFTQYRYGYNRRLFAMYKFRTMVAHAEALQSALEERNEAQGPNFKIWNDPRITSVGKLLRRTSIDELPQLWNVLRGDMSLVGPRPMATRDVHLFTEAALMRRFSVWPGLTGLWQVSGRSQNFEEWIALDLQYIDEWSLALDLRILLKTLPAVVRGTGAA
jgi:exopolysaccharide biosynthesis polyprenyl glycosylphosphotransferase